MTAQIAQTEQTLNNTQAVIEKKEKELQSLQKQAKEQHAAALTVQEIRSMGKKTITGNVSFTPSECNILKDYAVTGLLVKAENSRLEEKLRSAQCSAAIWKQRYDALYNAYQELKKEVQPYLDAVKLAPEKVRAFFDELLTRRTKNGCLSNRNPTFDKLLKSLALYQFFTAYDESEPAGNEPAH